MTILEVLQGQATFESVHGRRAVRVYVSSADAELIATQLRPLLHSRHATAEALDALKPLVASEGGLDWHTDDTVPAGTMRFE